MSKNRIFILNSPYAPRLNAELASEIGLNESIILLQLEYFISMSKHEIDGVQWTYQSISSLHTMFPFFSNSTINRAIKKLIELDLIREGNFNQLKFDRTRWFSLNYEGLSKLKSITLSGYEGHIHNYFESEVDKVDNSENLDVLSTEILQSPISQNDSSICHNDTPIIHFDSRANQNDSRRNQNDSCRNQNDTTIPKTTTNNKDIKDSQRSPKGVTSTATPKIKIYDDEVYKITDMMIEKIKANHPRAPVPDINKESQTYAKWCDEIDKLHRIGSAGGKGNSYGFREIWQIAKWSLDDDFWSINIMSTSKFRGQIVRLEAQYKDYLRKKDKTISNTSSTKPNTAAAPNKFHNFTKSSRKYTNEELEAKLGVRK